MILRIAEMQNYPSFEENGTHDNEVRPEDSGLKPTGLLLLTTGWVLTFHQLKVF